MLPFFSLAPENALRAAISYAALPAALVRLLMRGILPSILLRRQSNGFPGTDYRDMGIKFGDRWLSERCCVSSSTGSAQSPHWDSTREAITPVASGSSTASPHGVLGRATRFVSVVH